MTKDELDAWMEETKRSETRWTLDPVTLHNRGEYKFYKGGVDGVYIEVLSSGLAMIGRYEGAIPHIGEAFFKETYSRRVAKNAQDAVAYILSQLGLTFLLELIDA